MKISKKFDLIKEDLIKIGKGFLIALGGAVCAYLAQLGGVIDYTRYAEAAPYVAVAVSAFSSTVINIIQKWINTSTYVEEYDA